MLRNEASEREEFLVSSFANAQDDSQRVQTGVSEMITQQKQTGKFLVLSAGKQNFVGSVVFDCRTVPKNILEQR